MKSVCVKLQERCNIDKQTSFKDDNSMLFSSKLHSSGLTTRTIEVNFVALRVKEFQTISQFVLRAWNEHIRMLSFTENTNIKLHNQISKRITL